jgi:hypothetical protein
MRAHSYALKLSLVFFSFFGFYSPASAETTAPASEERGYSPIPLPAGPAHRSTLTLRSWAETLEKLPETAEKATDPKLAPIIPMIGDHIRKLRDNPADSLAMENSLVEKLQQRRNPAVQQVLLSALGRLPLRDPRTYLVLADLKPGATENKKLVKIVLAWMERGPVLETDNETRRKADISLGDLLAQSAGPKTRQLVEAARLYGIKDSRILSRLFDLALQRTRPEAAASANRYLDELSAANQISLESGEFVRDRKPALESDPRVMKALNEGYMETTPALLQTVSEATRQGLIALAEEAIRRRNNSPEFLSALLHRAFSRDFNDLDRKAFFDSFFSGPGLVFPNAAVNRIVKPRYYKPKSKQVSAAADFLNRYNKQMGATEKLFSPADAGGKRPSVIDLDRQVELAQAAGNALIERANRAAADPDADPEFYVTYLREVFSDEMLDAERKRVLGKLPPGIQFPTEMMRDYVVLHNQPGDPMRSAAIALTIANALSGDARETALSGLSVADGQNERETAKSLDQLVNIDRRSTECVSPGGPLAALVKKVRRAAPETAGAQAP